MNGAEIVVEALVDSGVDTLFGIPGLYNMALFDAAERHEGIDVVAVRHEQGATFMADGYGRATGRPAAVSLLPGCGVTNGLTGILQASSCSVPMVVLAAQIPSADIDLERGHLHEMTGQTDTLGRMCKETYRPRTSDELSIQVRNAVVDATAGRPRPVQVELPIDMLQLTGDPIGRRVDPPKLPTVDLAQIDTIASELAAAQRPLLYAGGGVNSSGASAELRLLAERLGAPVLVTGNGTGALPTNHRLHAGVPWVAAGSIEPLVEACDAFVAIGTRFDPAMCNMWNLPLPEFSVRIDIDAEEIERNIAISHLVHADAKDAITALLDHLEEDEAERSPSGDLALALSDYRKHQKSLVGDAEPWMNALQNSVGGHDIIVADMCLMWADMLHCFPVEEPDTVMFPWSLGTLGYGVPAAIGAKLGAPSRNVVSIAGDGAFLFTGAELAVAVERRLPIPFIVSNNDAYGMIRMQQIAQFGTPSAVDLVNPDFVALGAAYGADACRIETPAELELELKQAFERNGPTVIEVPWRSDFSVGR